MVEINAEIQCFADPNKICPIRAARQQVEDIHTRPIEERASLGDYNAQVRKIGKSLSWLDRQRFYGMLGTEFGRNILEPHSCDFGPGKEWGFFGKMVCNADVRYEEWDVPVTDTTNSW